MTYNDKIMNILENSQNSDITYDYSDLANSKDAVEYAIKNKIASKLNEACNISDMIDKIIIEEDIDEE